MKCQIPRLLLGLEKFVCFYPWDVRHQFFRIQEVTNGHQDQWAPMHPRPWNISWRLRIRIKSVTSYWHWRLLADVGMDGWMLGWFFESNKMPWMSFLFIAFAGTFQNICSHWTCVPRNYYEYDRHLPSQGDDGCCGCCFDSGRAAESNPTTRSATGEARGVPILGDQMWVNLWIKVLLNLEMVIDEKVRYNYSRSTCHSEPPSGAWLACAGNPFGCSEAEVETLGHPKWCKVMEGFWGQKRHLKQAEAPDMVTWWWYVLYVCRYVCKRRAFEPIGII